MENGLGSVDASEKAMKNEIMESRVEEKAKVGHHESKASVGDGDFKDSIAAEVPTILPKDTVISPVDDVANAGISNSSMVGHKKADSGTDFEKFEEAVDFPIEVENQVEKLDSIEDSTAAKPIDKPKVDEVGIVDGVMKEKEEKELDRVENDLVAHNKTDSGIDSDKFEEALDVPIDSNKKEEALANIDDTSEVRVGVGVEPVDKPLEQEIANGEGIREKKEEAESNRVANDDVAVSNQADKEIKVSDVSSAANDKEILEEEKAREVDISAVLDKKIQEDAIVEKHDNGVSDDVGLEKTVAHEVADNGLANVENITAVEEPKTVQSLPPVNSDSPQAVEIVESLDEGEKVEEVNKISSSLDNGHEDKKSFENNGDAASEVPINSVEEVKNPSSVTVKSEFEDEKVEKEIAERPKTLHENGTNKEINLAEDNRVENIEKQNRDLAPANLDHLLTNGKTESCVEKKEETHEVKRSPNSDDVAVDRGEKVQENASDKDVKGAKVSEIEAADKTVKSPNADTKKDETAGLKVAAAKQNTQGANGNSATLPARPAGLGRTAPLLETAPRVMQQNRVNGTSSQTQSQIVDEVANGETEENDETREKLQMIRVKFLRLAHRLGQTPHNVVVAQVLYRLGLAEQLRGRNGGRVAGFSFDRASAMAEQLEAAGQEPLDFSCTIMVLGKSGVGKSSTINSIFDEVKFSTDAFQQGTKKVQDVVGTVQGIKVRVIDTPGLLPSWSDQRQNEKILHSVKRFIKKTPPDIVLYLDRLDMQTRDLGDMPLLKTITDIFGPSIWFNAIVVLTHAASAPPEGANGTASSYEMFVTNRSHVVQQAIRQAAGDMRLMNPVSLVENHSACRKNRAGQRVLPNGQVWKPHLLLLSFASKILAEANTLLKLQDSPPGRPFATRTRAPPLPYLLSSLLQSRPQLKLPEDQLGDDEALGEDVDESSDSDDDSEYDELPPFRRLTKDQLGKLTKNQKKAYYDELEYREKLFMKKQLKEEKKRRKMMKNLAKEMPTEFNENIEEESGGAASVPVPMPDLALPASFDSDNPTHRYRYLDSSNSWVVRPVLDPNGWDHDIGYEGVNVEKLFVVKEKMPVSFSGQITKDKKDANMQMEMGSSIKHGEGKATTFGLDMQSLGKDMAYTLRTETKFSNYRKNKATAGFSVTKLGDTVSAGVKIEDQLIVNKRLRLVASGGAMTGRGDMAYGGSFEATLRDKDHPLGRSLSTLGLSVMDWHGDLAIGGNIQSQIPIGRSSNLIARANLNNKGSGQVSIRLNSSEQLQIVLVALVPLIRKLIGHVQLSQFGQ